MTEKELEAGQQESSWEILRDQIKVVKEDGDLLNQNPPAGRVLAHFFGRSRVVKVLVRAPEQERRRLAFESGDRLLNEVVRQRLSGTFSRGQLRDKRNPD